MLTWLESGEALDIDFTGLEHGIGEVDQVRRNACGYTANAVVARSVIAASVGERTEVLEAPEAFPTPGVLTIDDLAAPPYRIPADRQLKTVVYIADDRPVVAVLRGEHSLNQAKLQLACGSGGVRPGGNRGSRRADGRASGVAGRSCL